LYWRTGDGHGKSAFSRNIRGWEATDANGYSDSISKNSLMKSFTLALLFSAVTVGANAQTVYNTRAAYDLAHPGNYVIDFNNYTPAPTQYPDVTASTPVGNVNFDGIPSSENLEFLGSTTFPFLGPGNLVLYTINGTFLSDSLLITLPANTFTFGMDVISPSQTSPEPYMLTIYSGATVIGTAATPSVNGAYAFIGYDSLTSPITSVAVQISNVIGNPEPTIDNFTVVPEPGTGALIGTGTIALLLAARRRMRP
jgi:hypothetical protein